MNTQKYSIIMQKLATNMQTFDIDYIKLATEQKNDFDYFYRYNEILPWENHVAHNYLGIIDMLPYQSYIGKPNLSAFFLL